MNTLVQKPEFYNTLTNTCATNIVKHATLITPGRVPFTLHILTPKHIDEYAYNLCLLATSTSFEALKEKSLINSKVKEFENHTDFSKKIRE